MKRATLLILLSFVLTVTHVKADFIDANITYVSAQISNLNDFPDLAIVAYETKDSPGFELASVMTNSFRCMIPMSFCVVKKDYLKTVDLLKNDWHKDKHAQKLNLYMDRSMFNTPKFREILVDFKLAKKGETYYVYKSRVIYTCKTNGNKEAEKLVNNFNDKVVDMLKPINVSENIF